MRSLHFTMVVRAIAAAAMLEAGWPAAASAQAPMPVTVSFGPPAIPPAVQPPCPRANDIWAPGYWAYDPASGYYWVAGTWVAAPQPGLLWTPGYWGYNGGVYVWNAGYWASAPGFYGDIDYGDGYYGRGYAGGVWRGRTFRYNIAVTNVNPRVIHDVYVNASAVVRTANRVSYNGGRGGIAAIPTPSELAAEELPHLEATPLQEQHERNASLDRANFAAVNHGHPPRTIASSRG